MNRARCSRALPVNAASRSLKVWAASRTARSAGSAGMACSGPAVWARLGASSRLLVSAASSSVVRCMAWADEALQVEAGVTRQSTVLSLLCDAVDLRFGATREQGGALALRQGSGGSRQALLGQPVLDGLGPAAEQQCDVARHAVQLERAAAAWHDRVAELGRAHGQGLLVALAGLLGVDVEPDAPDALPFLAAADGGVHDHGMAV